MGNVSGNAYALTVLSPIKDGHAQDEIAYADIVRDRLRDWNTEPNSPMALVPQTYLCRFFVLDDVYTESLPGADLRGIVADLLTIKFDSVRRNALPKEDHLKSRYLVFSSNFYCGPNASPDAYLIGMWNAISARIKEVWEHCYGFGDVKDSSSFVTYMKQCELTASLFFVGSNDEPLEDQLKALYVKQELAKFAVENQGLNATVLRENYWNFIKRIAPDMRIPTWDPGKYRM